MNNLFHQNNLNIFNEIINIYHEWQFNFRINEEYKKSLIDKINIAKKEKIYIEELELIEFLIN
jgi:hypothetical protein